MVISEKSLKIDLGCGSHKRDGFTGIDLFPGNGVDQVADLEKGLPFLSDNSVDEFFTAHFLEHVRNLEFLLREIHLTLKPGGFVTVIVPHFSNPYFFSDYTHQRFFGLYSFDYFSSVKSKGYRRGVPGYNLDYNFVIESRKLVFKSPIFQLVNLIRKYLVQPFFNLSPYFQEVYEAFFTKTFQCSEIRFVLRPVK